MAARAKIQRIAKCVLRRQREPGWTRGFGAGSIVNDGRQETGRLVLSDDKKGRKKTGAGSGPGKNGPTRDVGGALRTVYQKTVEEQIPSEMLDLLGKLG